MNQYEPVAKVLATASLRLSRPINAEIGCPLPIALQYALKSGSTPKWRPAAGHVDPEAAANIIENQNNPVRVAQIPHPLGKLKRRQLLVDAHIVLERRDDNRSRIPRRPHQRPTAPRPGH